MFEGCFFRCIKLGEIKMRLVSLMHDNEQTGAFIYHQQQGDRPTWVKWKARFMSKTVESILNVDGTTGYKFVKDFQLPGDTDIADLDEISKKFGSKSNSQFVLKIKFIFLYLR